MDHIVPLTVDTGVYPYGERYALFTQRQFGLGMDRELNITRFRVGIKCGKSIVEFLVLHFDGFLWYRHRLFLIFMFKASNYL